jgi:hypothetical protein
MNHSRNFFHDLKKEFLNKYLKLTMQLMLTYQNNERRYVTTTDGKKMLVWVILPKFSK